MGSNAYRTAHNPPTPELLDACDRLGMLVMDETRMMSSIAGGLSQLERLIRRDRNHPSVIIWSIGNEEPAAGHRARRPHRRDHEAAGDRRLDPTRPVTEAVERRLRRQGVTDRGRRAGLQLPHPKASTPTTGAPAAARSSAPRRAARSRTRGDLRQRQGARLRQRLRRRTLRGGRRRPRRGGASSTPRRSSPAGSSGPASTIAASPRPTAGRASARTSASWTPAASPRTTSTTTRPGGRLEPVLHLFPHWNWAGREGQAIDVWVPLQSRPGGAVPERREPRARRTWSRNRHLAWKVPYAPGGLVRPAATRAAAAC